MSEKLNPSPKIPDGEYPELSPNPNYKDGLIQGEHGTPVRINTAPQRGIRQEPEPTNFAELYVGGKKPLLEGEVDGGVKLYKHYFVNSSHTYSFVVFSTTKVAPTDKNSFKSFLENAFINAGGSDVSQNEVFKVLVTGDPSSNNLYVIKTSFSGTISKNDVDLTTLTDTVTEL